MELYTVQPGDHLSAIAGRFGLPISQIIYDNQLTHPGELVIGQVLVLRFPKQIYTVQPGDTLSAIAQTHGVPLTTLYRNNPILNGQSQLWPGQTLVLAYKGETPGREIATNGYAYPFIGPDLLDSVLPFLTYLSPFTYGITPDGTLVPLEDQALLAQARRLSTGALMHLSTLTDEGYFSNELASQVLNNLSIQEILIENILQTLLSKGYSGLDVDFEFVFAQDAKPYADFIARLRARLGPLGFPVIVALAPKTSDNQPGLLYEGHNYQLLGQAADKLLLMTYEWGYTYGPPMAVAPLPNVKAVVEYALTRIPPEKLWLGIPCYGYDWPLPYEKGVTKATSLSPQQAIDLARQYGVAIQYDERAQSPWFHYTDDEGRDHQVWFEDARSIAAKLDLLQTYDLSGIGYWNLMRPFPQNWLLLNHQYTIAPGRN